MHWLWRWRYVRITNRTQGRTIQLYHPREKNSKEATSKRLNSQHWNLLLFFQVQKRQTIMPCANFKIDKA